MDKKSITEIIISLEKAALEEWNRGNPSPYLDIYSKEITYFDPMQEKRIDGLDDMRKLYEGLKGEVKVNTYEMINPVVQATDNMAVLTYNLHSYTNENLWKWNCTEVYMLDESKEWKIIHNHWSLTKPNIQ